MFKTLLKNKKAQNTAEYALLIALVVAGVIAMQTYAQRALQARMRDASLKMAEKTSDIGTTNQYEPYYLRTQYNIDRDTTETSFLTANTAGSKTDNTRGRDIGGFQESSYNTVGSGI